VIAPGITATKRESESNFASNPDLSYFAGGLASKAYHRNQNYSYRPRYQRYRRRSNNFQSSNELSEMKMTLREQRKMIEELQERVSVRSSESENEKDENNRVVVEEPTKSSTATTATVSTASDSVSSTSTSVSVSPASPLQASKPSSMCTTSSSSSDVNESERAELAQVNKWIRNREKRRRRKIRMGLMKEEEQTEIIERLFDDDVSY
jgi:hypothetical protein